MRVVRRSAHLFLFLRDECVPNLSALLQGKLQTTTVPTIVAISLPGGHEVKISESELRVLSRIPSDRWVHLPTVIEGLDAQVKLIEGLIEKGLLVANEGKRGEYDLYEADQKVEAQEWFPSAALYHFTSKWRDVGQQNDVPSGLVEYGVEIQEQLVEHAERQGKAPSHFHEIRGAEAIVDLPIVEKEGAVYRLLSSRRTNRIFDSQKKLSREDLATILYYVFGCRGLTRFSENLTIIKKTSPSGGSMHPVEVYPLILRVEGLETGLYHYNVARHALERLRKLSIDEAEDWVTEFAAGQVFLRSASALFVMTARFRRNFWKYPNHAKAYRVVLMDAAHLSQTLYLVCTDLKLGAFLTVAINEANIEAKLGLDGIEEGALGISACGVVDDNPPMPPFRHGSYEYPSRTGG